MASCGGGARTRRGARLRTGAVSCPRAGAWRARCGGRLCAASAAPRPTRARPSDLLLDGLATLVTEGRAVAAPTLRRAIDAFRGGEFSVEKGLQWGVLASSASVELWDFESWDAVITRHMEL